MAATAAALVAAAAPQAQAGDREWATAGKVLTGVIAGTIIAKSFEAPPVYTYEATYVAPAPVVVQSAPVVVQRAPVYVAPPPVVVAQPVYVAPAPTYYVRPAPVVSFSFGFGHGHRHYVPAHHHHHHHRVCR
ncbi:MAG: hypothetical protein AB1705_04115 [Verrucomicrobiota bacterium]